MKDWRPIETAPKDGSSLLLFDAGITIGCWRAAINGFHDCVGGDWDSDEAIEPTHWMPLPDPPSDWVPDGYVAPESGGVAG